MPIFNYQAIDQGGRSLSGTMPAQDESNLEQRLKEAGLWLTEATLHSPKGAARAPKTGPRGFKLSGRRGRREMIDFCTLMTFQLRSGISVVKALDVAAQDCKSPGFKGVLTDLQRQIESGLQLHEALAKYPKVFSSHFLSIVKAGEATGNQPEAFDDLRQYLE